MINKINVSVFIMTLNEEQNLPACVRSLSWADEVFILDSGSTDRTQEVAQQLGCNFVTRKLVTWAEQQTWAVKNLPFRNDWVLNIDADEIVPCDLAEEIRTAISTGIDTAGYRFRRKDYFLGKWLKHASFYPLWLTRLYRPRNVTFERLVNPVTTVRGRVQNLRGHLIHYPFSKGVTHWFQRHNDYSSLEAREVSKGEAFAAALLFNSDVAIRRQAKKAFFNRLPCRPLIKFVYLYIAKAGFLDGEAGLHYSIMQAFYEFMISAKLLELKAAKDTFDPRLAE
jgi:glycosyltransferase involved in cell wall biosynthesis